ncbi:hypothetical protein EST38_g8280 [Candolleomyces aberdarensis]|uniref:Fungal-type protein kinase domain-containing protein n=1 Tax=Candolleomyces aberdarensis TaxID=2316362 RepID=A0A4V1Q371_9AGAR|nr:hypothetical protein EST38_g8280 [Candolleomyces aberdarensis]
MPAYPSSETSTAYSTTTQDSVEGRENFLHDPRVQELGEISQLTDEGWTRSLYLDLFAKKDIEKYLTDSGEYSNGRWVRIPEGPALASDLHQPLCIIINSIVQYLGSPGLKDTRKAVNTDTTAFKCPAIDSAKHTSPPNIVIKASGPSFTPPKCASLGFPNAAACIDANLDAELVCDLDQVAEMSFYAKEMFIEQPNRFFVRSLLITEQQVRLFHFDRSGAQYTPFFNIHKEAHTFIRLILGLCAVNEVVLGLDGTVQWIIGLDGRRTRGILEAIGPDNVLVTYELAMDEAPFTRAGVRGRGTTCWPVRNARGDMFIVKDYWMSGGRAPEFELLEEAKGLSGVCQMVSYEGNRAQTKDFRGETSAFKVGSFHNRTAIRIVMKAYGPSLENFSTVEQFLAALRDAIAGHRGLLAKNVLHRDVSPNNILLGPSEADEGEHGTLIDLDISLRLPCDGPIADDRANFNIGTRMFQSLMVLMTYDLKPERISAHDYLDDLEAFFWVFAYIIIVYKSNGEKSPLSPLRRAVRLWNQEASLASSSKYPFLHSANTPLQVEETIDQGWHFACLDLFIQFKDYMSQLAGKKEKLTYASRDPNPNRFSSLLEPVDKHYDHILALFDDALEKVRGAHNSVKESD